jgi:hypothetical protein
MAETLSEFLVQPDGYQDAELVQDFLVWQLQKLAPKIQSEHGIQLLSLLSRQLYPPTDRDHGWPHIAAVQFHLSEIIYEHTISEDEYYALNFGAVLHDSVRYNHYSPAVASAIFTEKLLAPYVTPAVLELTLHAIIQHSCGKDARYKPTRVTQLLYDADKADTNRVRWSQWGLDPNRYVLCSIEGEYAIYLDLVLGTLSTKYTYDILRGRYLELEYLKNVAVL